MRSYLKYLKGDPVIWIITLLMMAFSLVTVYSFVPILIKIEGGSPFIYLFKHLVYVVLGFGAMYTFTVFRLSTSVSWPSLPITWAWLYFCLLGFLEQKSMVQDVGSAFHSWISLFNLQILPSWPWSSIWVSCWCASSKNLTIGKKEFFHSCFLSGSPVF